MAASLVSMLYHKSCEVSDPFTFMIVRIFTLSINGKHKLGQRFAKY